MILKMQQCTTLLHSTLPPSLFLEEAVYNSNSCSSRFLVLTFVFVNNISILFLEFLKVFSVDCEHRKIEFNSFTCVALPQVCARMCRHMQTLLSSLLLLLSYHIVKLGRRVTSVLFKLLGNVKSMHIQAM